MNEFQIFPKLPLSDWIETFVEFLDDTFAGLFEAISVAIQTIADGIINIMSMGSPYILIVVISLLAWWAASWKVGLFSIIGLELIHNLGYWPETIQTLTLIIISVLICVVIGIPIGVWMSQSNRAQWIITPILDFMQTMPAFVYLIPAILFFSLGIVPGVVATIIFSMPPTVRFTNLGIRQVDGDLIEAANSFGSSVWQRLFKVQLPLAKQTLMAGVNQTIMLSLSMVVIASLVGAPGLGEIVYRAVTQVRIGLGFEGGLALVIIAMILDRMTQGSKKKKRG
ncbi:MAG TPA: proline/glycine betaine ABC transporter permease [Candidatus Avamphibacillus intestinigallinarum]|nr:proline/glycine betaine ABC transporter permease [Candidatus Avamphibacillus intestinigallinarum]